VKERLRGGKVLHGGHHTGKEQDYNGKSSLYGGKKGESVGGGGQGGERGGVTTNQYK